MKGIGSKVAAFILATTFLLSIVQPNMLLKADLAGSQGLEVATSNSAKADNSIDTPTDDNEADASPLNEEPDTPSSSENEPQPTANVDEPEPTEPLVTEPTNTEPLATETLPTEEPTPSATGTEMTKSTLTPEQIAKLKELANKQETSVLLTNDSPMVRANELTVEQREGLLESAFYAADADYPSSGDDSKIIALTTSWVTADTFNDTDPNLLSLKWQDDISQHVQMKVNFSLGGEHDYTSSNGQAGYISDGSTLKIRHAETITVKGLPLDTKVSVTEEKAEGYTLDAKQSVLTGIVQAADTVESALQLSLVNIYDAAGTLTLEGDKGVIGHSLENKAFNFLVLENGEVMQRATNDATGKIHFTDLHYTLKDAGTKHTYTIAEEKGLDSHYIYDRREYKLVVEVKDDGNGKLIVEKQSGSDSKFNFTNRYCHDLPTTGKEDLIIAGSVGALLILIALYLSKHKHKGGGSD